MLRYPLCGQLGIALALCLLAGTGFAQSEREPMTILKSTPEAGSTLTESPKSVRIWFDRVPKSEAWSLVIEGASAEHEVSYVHTMGENDLMGMLLESLPDGEYKLRWRWESQSGEVPFTLRRPEGAGG